MNRIKQMRLAKGFSLEALAKAMEGAVTKQALSKYEKGLAKPTATVAVRLAAALGVKTLQLWEEPAVTVEFVAYRRLSRLGKKEQVRIEALTTKTLEDRCRLQGKLGLESSFEQIISHYPIYKIEEAEHAAAGMRKQWNLGVDAIHDLTGILEDRLIHVLELDAQREFDGISAIAKNKSGRIIAGAVTSRKVVAGERQRMNLAHELGHLVLKPTKGCDEEKAAFRFAGAFLLPEESLKREIGERRSNIQLAELLALKRRFKVSIQAVLYRMLDLDVISESLYKQWAITISQQRWRKQEPESITPEKSDWLNRMLSRALAEGIITTEEAENMSGSIQLEDLPAPTKRAEFLRLPLEERRKLLKAQAEHLHKYYESLRDELDLETSEGLEDD